MAERRVLRAWGALVLGVLLCIGLTAANGEGKGRKRAYVSQPQPAKTLQKDGVRLTLSGAPPQAEGCAAETLGWEAWRDKRIESLLALSEAPLRNRMREPGQDQPYLNLESVMERATDIADEMDRCQARGFAAPPSVANLASFARLQRNANYLLDRPFHQFGHGVYDQDYLDRVSPAVALPCLLQSQAFLQALSAPATYQDALDLIARQNAGQEAAGCAPEPKPWTTLLYVSRFLGTPDAADVLGRLLVVVPALDENRGHDRWVQFGVYTPGETIDPGKPLQNVSVVAVARGARPQDEGRFDAIVDWYRCRGDCQRADPREDVSLKLRYVATGETGNCQECHKSTPLSIWPRRVFRDASWHEMAPAEAASAVAAVNARLPQRPPAYPTGTDDALASSCAYGPPLGALPQHYAIAGRRTADSVRTCSAPWKLSETSLKRVAAAMGCGGCHDARDKAERGALNYPQATEKRNSTTLAFDDDRDLGLLDVAPNMIQTLVTEGHMPPEIDELQPEERQALYRCLSSEYFEPAANGQRSRGLLVDWLRQQGRPQTLLAATATPGAAPDPGEVMAPCLSCHAWPQGAQCGAPPLAGVIGRQAASTRYAGHSEALAQLGRNGLRWDEATLMEFLRSPDAFLQARGAAGARSTMAAAYPDEALRRSIVDYLKRR